MAEKQLERRNRKTSARSSLPKSDGTRSLIRTLGLKVGRIVIDPGHGGHDTGTIGPSGLQEKDLVLDIALKLKALVEEKLGSEVLSPAKTTHSYLLKNAPRWRITARPTLFLSIHANSSRNRRVSGVEHSFWTLPLRLTRKKLLHERIRVLKDDLRVAGPRTEESPERED
jgi:N-acetylmuramoyl-L-alanine amidase